MANSNDSLGILIRTLLDQSSKKNVTTEVETLVKTLQGKLGNLKINIGGTGLQQLVTQLNQVSKLTRNIGIPQKGLGVQFEHALNSTIKNLESGGRKVTATWDSFGKVVFKVTNEVTGKTEKYNYQWTQLKDKLGAVTEQLVRINREQTITGQGIEQLKTKYQGMINSLQNSKLGSFVNVNELRSFENTLKNINVLDGQISAKLLNQYKLLVQNAQAAKNQETSIKSVYDKLNTRMQNALNLEVKIKTLSPEAAKTLEHQLNRYKQILQSFQDKNKLGIKIDEKELLKLQNLENRIKRFYENTKNNLKDSRGFDFSQYPKMQNAVQGATNAQNYYNQSIIKGKKLLEANVAETDKYIKVTQRLRQGSQIQTITAYINKATGETHRFSQSMKDLMTRTWDVGSAFKTAFEKISLWAGATGIFYGMVQGLKDIGRVIVEIDTKLVELSKVLSNDTDFTTLMKDTAIAARDFGRSITQAMDAEIEFAKQGFEAVDAVNLARAAMLGANVTGLKTADVADRLVGILAQFNLTADESTRVIDRINEVDNNFAVTSVGLMQGLQKAGETAQQFGFDLDTLIGYITAVSTATRESGNQIGNAFKFMFARLNMDKAQEALASIGVATHDVTGELRAGSEIYSEVANRWEYLSRAQRTYVAESLSGKHHITRFMALMDNWKISQDAMVTSQHSLNSSVEENVKHMNSLAAQFAKVSASAQTFAFSIGEHGVKSAMHGVLSILNIFINGLNSFVNASGIAKISIISLTTALILLRNAWLQTNFVVGVSTFANLISVFGTLKTMIVNATAATLTFSAALLTNPLTWIVTAIAGLTMFVGKQKEIKAEQERVNNIISESNQKIDEFKNKLNELNNIGVKGNVSNVSMQEISDIETRIKSYDKLIKKVEEYDSKMKWTARGSRAYTPSDLSEQDRELALQLGINASNYKNNTDLLNALNDAMKNHIDLVNKAKETSIEYNISENDKAKVMVENSNAILGQINEYKNLIAVNVKNEEQSKRIQELEVQLGVTKERTIEIIEDEAKVAKNASEQILSGSKDVLQGQYQATLAVYNNTVERLAYYSQEMKALDKLIAKMSLVNKSSSLIDTNTNSQYAGEFKLLERQSVAKYNVGKLTDEAETLSSDLEKIRNQLGSAPKLVGSGNTGSDSKSGGGSSSIKENKEFTNSISEIELAIKKLQTEREKLTQGSEKYRNSIQQEINLTQQKLNLINKEISKTTDKEKLLQLQGQQLDVIKEMDNLTNNLRQDRLLEFDNSIQKITSHISLLEQTLNLYDEGSSDYNKTLVQLIEKQEQYIEQLKEKEIWIKKELQNTNLSIAQQEELENKLNEVTKAQIDAQVALRSKLSSIAQEIVDIEKSALELLKQAKQDEVDEKIKAEEKYHDTVIKGYENDLKAFEESINAKKRLLADASSERSYNQELSDLQKEQLEIQKKIDSKQLDDSIEARKELADLRKQLSEKVREIENLQYNRSKELQEQNLDDQLDNYKEQIEAKKEQADEEFDETKNSLDKQKKHWEKYYDNLLNDERHWASIRENILNGHLDTIKSDLDSFSSQIDRDMSGIGRSIKQNVIDKFAQAQDIIGQLYESNNKPPSGSGSNNSGGNNPIATLSSSSYGYVGGTAVLPAKQLASILGATAEWNQSTGQVTIGGKKFIPAKNDNGTAYLNIRQVAEALGHKVNYDNSSGAISIYHKGGLVKNSTNKPSKIMDIVNKLFNTTPNEQIAKLALGEVVTNERNVLNNFIPNFGNMINNLIPKIDLQAGAGGGGYGNQIVNINIKDVHTQDQGSLNKFFGTIRTELNKLGK